ncbi:hypothetical protein RI129_010206 [Pyrocoelia pectoralis]|uniref:Uncharacterized protein n=1 Tax=Pyrocoelia pectoralis TaxID=417401 RepID=A0AAN7VE24_9COLE
MTVADIEKAKSKLHPGFRKNFVAYFAQYSDSTTIHGVRYLGQYGRSIIERFWWFLVIGSSLYLCIKLILATYDKWITSPVIVSFARSPTPVWQIPFPAVTVCPETKTLQRVYNFTHEYHRFHENPENMTEEEIEKFNKVSLVCNNRLHTVGEKIVDDSVFEVFNEVAPPFDDVLWQCKWLNENQTCASLLTQTLTEEGVCFTFNMLENEAMYTNNVYKSANLSQFGIQAMEWSLESGYATYLGTDTYPKRTIASGQKACFSLLMTLYEPDMDYLCKGAVQGFKILLHNPAETPKVTQHYFRAPLNQEVIVVIKPDMMTTSEGLRSYTPNSRLCFFQDERQLMYYQMYTQKNCEVECLTNITLQRCGCVAFHMPRNQTTKMCGPGNALCMKRAEAEMHTREVDLDHANANNIERCNCLPSCTSLTYNAELSQAYFNWPKVFEGFQVNFSEFPGVAMSRVFFFFKEQQFITSERNELYGLTDFLSSCGGLLGLFIGFSSLSIIEIIYFLSLRLMGNIKNYGRHYWSGSTELINNESFKNK